MQTIRLNSNKGNKNTNFNKKRAAKKNVAPITQ